LAKEVYITMKEAASLLGVTSSTLRNWDKKEKLKAIRDTANNYRVYPLSLVLSLQNKEKESLAPVATSIDSLKKKMAEKTMTFGELRRLLRGLHSVLRDNEGNSSLIERFDELTKILYCKVYEEKNIESEGNIFGGNAVESDSTIANRIRTFYDKLVSSRNNIFPDRFSKIKLNTKTLVQLAEVLSSVKISQTRGDLKGLAYEEIIKNTFEKGDNQQFFTPRTIVNFMVEMVEPWLSGSICDPACGTGGFLLQASMFLCRNGKPQNTNFLGIEIDERLAWVTRMNLDMHNIDNFKVLCIPETGSLGEKIKNYCNNIDVILTNPPFGSDLSEKEVLETFKLGQSRTSRRRGVLFIERCLDLVKPGGVVAIIIDDGVLNSPSNEDTRRLILKKAHPFAIVSLPSTAFMPYASVKASILFLQKKGGRNIAKERETFFASAEEVGRKPNGEPLLRWNKLLNKMELNSDLGIIKQKWGNGRCESLEYTDNGGSIFWKKLQETTDIVFMKGGFRLDIAYHHPSRQKAVSALKLSKYPLNPLSEICSFRSEAAIPSKDFYDEEITYIGLANIEAHTGFCSPELVNGSSLKSSVKRFLKGDILFTKMRPELRKVCLIPDDIDEGFASSECLVIIPNKKDDSGNSLVMIPELLALLLKSDLVYGQIVHMVIGIGRPRVSKDTILNIQLPVPPLKEQIMFLESFKKSRKIAESFIESSEKAFKKASKIMSETQGRLVLDMLGEKEK